MAILTYIDGHPLFNSNKEARDHGKTLSLKGTHVHRYSKGPHNYRTGYMAGATHDSLINNNPACVDECPDVEDIIIQPPVIESCSNKEDIVIQSAEECSSNNQKNNNSSLRSSSSYTSRRSSGGSSGGSSGSGGY